MKVIEAYLILKAYASILGISFEHAINIIEENIPLYMNQNLIIEAMKKELMKNMDKGEQK